MRADISLAGKHADLKFTVRYNGSDDNPVRIQELPAVFLSRKLGQLVFYDGPEPWQVGGCCCAWFYRRYRQLLSEQVASILKMLTCSNCLLTALAGVYTHRMPF
jgi:hypothetical protein